VRYRYLHPRLGRWVSRDPLAEPWFKGLLNSRPILNSHEPNLCSFAQNNPGARFDGLGLQSIGIVIQCARVPGMSFEECVCTLWAPDTDECIERAGACLKFIGNKFKDVGELCDCLCRLAIPPCHDNKCKNRLCEYHRCVNRCAKLKAMKRLFDRHKERNLNG
jgi:hypothetical protein